VFGTALVSRRNTPPCHHRDMTLPVVKRPWWKNPRLPRRLARGWAVVNGALWISILFAPARTASLIIATISIAITAAYLATAGALRRHLPAPSSDRWPPARR
jgi:hypothetical protein